MAFFLVDKKAGVTSHDVVTKVRKVTESKKAGHGGTLDPFATGLLIIATEGHTRLLNKLLGERKTYTGIIKFGQTTETLDPESMINETAKVNFSESDIRQVINEKFKGVISQRPPRFSSIKVNGVKAYERARAGEQFELKSVKREIYKFNVKLINETEYSFEVEASSGTYIRALARDLAKELNTVGMLTNLRRNKIGTLSVDLAGTEEEPKEATPHKVLLLEEVNIKEHQMKMILQGKTTKITLDRERPSFIARCNNDEVYVSAESARHYKIIKRIK